ncbi:NCS2 family permease [Mycoplasmatota bacterium WC44]
MKIFLDKFFKLQENGTNIKTEFVAGLTTFLAMAYILFVNSDMLSKTGMSFGAVFTATAIAAIVGTLVMALLANYPVALAPGMGLNAFFTFGVVFGMGFTWQLALAAVFVSGILFMILSLSGIREKIINAIPNNLKYAVGGGIGLFIAFIGLKNAGIVAFDTPAGVVEGNAVVFDVIPMLGTFSGNTLLATIGLIITIVLYVRGTKGAIFLGIVATSVIGMIMGLVNLPTEFVKFPEPPHFGAFVDGFKDISSVGISSFLIVVFSFLFVDFFDTAGTLVTVGRRAGLINEQGELKGSSKALLADSTATVVGAVVGTSNTTSYIESLAGIEEGGRTGLTSVFTALFFLIFMFFAPMLSVVTAAVTAPALIMVGILMASQLKHIEWDKIEVSIPAFLTLILMPLTYSIANGIAIGFIAYTIAMVAKGKYKEVSTIMYILSVIFIVFFII